MFRYALIASALVLSFGAQAEPYSSTLSPEEQERHEFMDTQQSNFPSGRITPSTGSTLAPQVVPNPSTAGSTFVPTPSPWLNDRPVLTTR